MAVFTETIKLDDQVSGPAKAAAGAFDLLSKGLAATEKQLVKAAALGDVGAFRKATKDAEAFKIALGQLDQGLLKEAEAAKLADAANKQLAKDGAAAAAAATKKLSEEQDFASKTSASLSEDMAVLAESLAAMAAAAVAAAVVGLGALVFAGAKFAITSSEAKNASIALFEAMGQGVISGEQVDNMLDDLRSSTGLTKDSLSGLTTTFLKMGVTGEDALKGLTVAAASAEALGKGGGAAFATLYEKIEASAAAGEKLTIPFKKLTSQLSAVGLNAGDVAKSMGITTEALTKGLEKGTIDAKKFGSAMQDAVTKKGVGPMKQLANSSANLGKLLEEYLGDLFEDLGDSIAPFMAAVKDLFSILDQANPSGQALKDGIGAFFKEVFRWASVVVPMIKHFLLDVIIYGIKAYIFLKPIIAWFKELAANQTVIDAFNYSLKLVGALAAGLAVAFVLVVGALTLVTAGIVGLITGMVWVAQEIGTFIGESMKSLTGWAASATTAAYDFVAGLVNGITSGAGMVIGAVTGLADSAVGAFKGALGINSPSTVMMGFGQNMGEGVVGGVESTEGDVHGASSNLAGAAVNGMAAGAAAAPAAAPSGGGNTIHVTVTIDGAGKDAMGITQEMVSACFEQMALQAGV